MFVQQIKCPLNQSNLHIIKVLRIPCHVMLRLPDNLLEAGTPSFFPVMEDNETTKSLKLKYRPISVTASLSVMSLL